MLVGELCIGNRELPLQVASTDRLEPLVGLGIDPGDEEARDREHLARVASGGDEPLEATEIGLGNGGIALEREDQRHIDRDTLGDAVLDRTEPGLGSRDLDVEVRPIDLIVEAKRLLEGAFALVRECRVNLERHPPVDPRRALPDRAHQIASATDVVHREREEDLGRVVGPRRELAQLGVVEVAIGECFLEDRRVGRHADDRVVGHETGEHSGMKHLSREGVDPDANACATQLRES